MRRSSTMFSLGAVPFIRTRPPSLLPGVVSFIGRRSPYPVSRTFGKLHYAAFPLGHRTRYVVRGGIAPPFSYPVCRPPRLGREAGCDDRVAHRIVGSVIISSRSSPAERSPYPVPCKSEKLVYSTDALAIELPDERPGRIRTSNLRCPLYVGFSHRGTGSDGAIASPVISSCRSSSLIVSFANRSPYQPRARPKSIPGLCSNHMSYRAGVPEGFEPPWKKYVCVPRRGTEPIWRSSRPPERGGTGMVPPRTAQASVTPPSRPSPPGPAGEYRGSPSAAPAATSATAAAAGSAARSSPRRR